MFTKKLPIIRGFQNKTLPYHVGSTLENVLGLQPMRMTSKYLLWKLRKGSVKQDIKNYIESLERDGVLVLENFLSSDEFANVVNEFENAAKEVKLLPYKGDAGAKLYRTQISTLKQPENFNFTIKYFQKNEMLNEIASAVIHRKVKEPEVSLDIYQKINDEGFDNDIENILHADLHTSTVKMFFYLNDVNEMNGAFIYAKGSHKLTIERLKHEYDLSIRQAKLKSKKNVDKSFLSKRGDEVRNIIKPEHFAKMKVNETQVCVKKNTLVIANNMGFHRRGEFIDSTPRKSLLINYRNSERPIL